MDGTGQAEAGAFLFTGFGAPLYTGSGSANASPLKYGGANDCQTDADTGLVLMGHRYYDTRTGRFISQDKMEEGTNWYAYCRNNPVNNCDPSGLECTPFNSTGMTEEDIINHVMTNGGMDGETYVTRDAKGNELFEFTIGEQLSGFHDIPGYSVSQAFQDARRFANTPIPQGATKAGYGKSLPTHLQKLMWVFNHFHTNSGGDPKKALVGGGKNPLYTDYDNIGNYGFGAIIAGVGLSLQEGQVYAGLFQSWQALTKPDGGWTNLLDNTIQNGTVLGGPPYGDDPWSQAMIQQGYNDYSHR